MTLTPEPAATGPGDREAAVETTEQTAADRRRADMLEQLIAMRRDEAAAEDAEDFGWADELRSHPFPARAERDNPGSPAPA